MRIHHWQDMASALVGAWLIASPFALGFDGTPAWITDTLGLCVLLFEVEGLLLPSYAEELCEGAAGLLLVAAPWVVFYGFTLAMYNSMVAGIAVIALAASELLTDREFVTWWRGHTHHPAG